MIISIVVLSNKNITLHLINPNADLHKVQLKKQFSNVEFIKEGEIKVGDQNAYEMEFTGVLGGENMHGRYIVLTTSTNLYAILGGVNAGMWNELKDTINTSIQTFKAL